MADPEKKSYSPLEAQHIDIKRLPQTGFELFGRHKELTLLNDAWKSGTTNVVSFVAYGGVGKSTLVNKWVEKLRWENYRGAEKVYAWSFYSQGTNERTTSADAFISHALGWFGDADPTQGSPWDKGKRLAQLVRQHKTLLVLDGLEPLQTAEKFDHGKIKDPALEMLIRELAKSNPGLCVMTTREWVPELDRYPDKANQLNLEQISDEAGRKLLETRRIAGAEQELEQTVQLFGNHALAINLLAEYLHMFENHPLNQAKSIPDLNIPVEQGRHARRMIEAFGTHFGDDSCEFQLLSLLGLFDRPVPVDAISAIIHDNPITDLSNKITDTCGREWLATLKNLRKRKLLFKECEHHPDTLDCHPLIREHFGEKLQKDNPKGRKEAHARLYEYYKNKPEKELPDTLEEMEPLFAAVMHGCLAGKQQEAHDEVYFNRIRRKNEYYILKQLGAFGAFISVLSNFYETLWSDPFKILNNSDIAVILSGAGYALHAVGRLSEAAQPMQAGLEAAIKDKDWRGAAQDASNLSELYLTLGDVAAAQKYGAQSVTFADRSGDEDWIFLSRTTHADALHQAGHNQAAEKLFLEAESMQQKRQPEYPYLYSLQGFRFCDLLLSIGKVQEVLERARKALEIVLAGSNRLLDIALNNLTIGKALMLLEDFSEALKYLNQAVNGLREARIQDQFPRGLLARATLYRHQQEFPKSWTDLDEAREIAEYGSMRLHLTDYHLEACRNINAQLAVAGGSAEFEIMEKGESVRLPKEEMEAKFRQHLQSAEQLIQETGYHRRDKELGELRNKRV